MAVEARDPDAASVKAFPGRRDNLTGSQDTVTVDLDATGKGQAAVSLTCNALGGWQPNAFTQVYLGYSQSRKTDLNLTAPLERLIEKGLFGKASYAIRF